jgi:hypothetical protein
MAQSIERKPKTAVADPDGSVLAPLAPEPEKPPLDPCRFGVIEVRFEGGPPAIYRLTVAGQLWSSVEWSPTRRRWCIEDGVNQCLAHVEHIHGEDPDPQAAIRLAKRMIRDGRMPTPEEARAALRRKDEGKD